MAEPINIGTAPNIIRMMMRNATNATEKVSSTLLEWGVSVVFMAGD
jgi:hypothetical protein